MTEKLITFGQLLAIKREALGMNQTDCRHRWRIQVGHYENGKRYPQKKTLECLMKHLSITEEELNACKDYPFQNKWIKQALEPKYKMNIEHIATHIRHITEKLEQKSLKGAMGQQIKEKCTEVLKKIHSQLHEIALLDDIL